MFVLSKVSRRGVHGVACDLLRVVCRVRAREVREALRGRLNAFSSGYLVSDDFQFSGRRWAYGAAVELSAVTGGGGVPRGGIDAPEFLAAGGCRNYSPFIFDGECAGILVQRGFVGAARGES